MSSIQFYRVPGAAKTWLVVALFLQSVAAFCATRSVTLAWDANSEPAIIGYSIR